MKRQPRKVNICKYTVKPGKEDEMLQLLAKHYPALLSAGLASEEQPVIYRGLPSSKDTGDHGAENVFVEIFSWKTDDGPRLAHESPEVMAVWEPMGAICSKMEFPMFEEMDLPLST